MKVELIYEHYYWNTQRWPRIILSLQFPDIVYRIRLDEGRIYLERLIERRAWVQKNLLHKSFLLQFIALLCGGEVYNNYIAGFISPSCADFFSFLLRLRSKPEAESHASEYSLDDIPF